MNTDGTGFHTCNGYHKTESLWNHTTTDHKEGEQLEDRRSVGASSCNSGDGTDQRVQFLMFMTMMKSEDDMGETPGTYGGEVKCRKSFGGETWRKKPFRKSRRSGEDKIKKNEIKTWRNSKARSNLCTLYPSYTVIILIHLSESFLIFHNCALDIALYFCYYSLLLCLLPNLLFMYPRWFVKFVCHT